MSKIAPFSFCEKILPILSSELKGFAGFLYLCNLRACNFCFCYVFELF